MQARSQRLSVFAIAILCGWAWVARKPAYAAELGGKVPDFRLSDTTGKVHTTADYSGRILVITFWSFKCPVSIVYDERLREISEKYPAGQVSIIAVDSNSNESKAEVERNAKNRNLPFPILLDEDGGLADKLSATLAPSNYVFDSSGALRYQGPLDNNKRPGDRGRIPYLENALNDLVSGRRVANPEFPFSGCAIRRRTS